MNQKTKTGADVLRSVAKNRADQAATYQNVMRIYTGKDRESALKKFWDKAVDTRRGKY